MKETVWKLKKVCETTEFHCPFLRDIRLGWDSAYFCHKLAADLLRVQVTATVERPLRHPDCPLTEIVMR